MIVPARTKEERRDLVVYLAHKIGTTPARLMGEVPFEVLAATRGSTIVGAIYYTNFRRSSIEMGWAGEKGWVTRAHLREIFGYPFNQLGCLRVWGLIDRHNKESRTLAEKLGCRVVGVADDEYGPGRDAIIYSMKRDACRWIEPVAHVDEAPPPLDPPLLVPSRVFAEGVAAHV